MYKMFSENLRPSFRILICNRYIGSPKQESSVTSGRALTVYVYGLLPSFTPDSSGNVRCVVKKIKETPSLLRRAGLCLAPCEGVPFALERMRSCQDCGSPGRVLRGAAVRPEAGGGTRPPKGRAWVLLGGA